MCACTDEALLLLIVIYALGVCEELLFAPILFCHVQTYGAVSSTMSVIMSLPNSAGSGSSVLLDVSAFCAIELPYSRISHGALDEIEMS
jgi:hypothetical protein